MQALRSKTPMARTIKFIAIFVISWIISFTLPDSPLLTDAGRWTGFIFFSGALLWITEVIPAFSTGLLIAGLNVLILGKPGGVFAVDDRQWTMFVQPFTSPIILIFFGGFVLSMAIEKYGIDKAICQVLVKKSGDRPKFFLFIVMATTAVFSMFMSNTATTAMMFALLGGIIIGLPASEAKFKTGLSLAIPFAANLGGIGTIIGTPPNAIAVGNLGKLNPPVNISFSGWMIVGMPYAIVMLGVAFLVIWYLYKPTSQKLTIEVGPPETFKMTRDIWIVFVGFGVTAFLWITSEFTGMPPAVAAIVPVMIFSVTGLMKSKDLQTMDWGVLLLVGGALSLGEAIKVTGFGTYFLSLFSVSTVSPIILVLVLIAAIVTLGNFMSHTAATAMLVPMVMAIPDANHTLNVIVVAIASSLAMMLPISTPPNAIAYSKGTIQTTDMVKSGAIITVVGILLLVAGIFIARALNFPAYLFNN
jgi:solute carrier family 13 (sodium-dependent dicarboxylate transporter), member 2/3/5